MPPPIKQTIQLDFQSPAESASLAGQLKQLREIQAVINQIHGSSSKGLVTPDLFNKSQADLQKLINQLPVKGRTAMNDIFKGLKVPPEFEQQLRRIAQKFQTELQTSFKLAPTTQTFQNTTGVAGAMAKIFSELNREIEKGTLRMGQKFTPAVSAVTGGKTGIDAGTIKAAVEGKIQVIIPASQIQAVVEGGGTFNTQRSTSSAASAGRIGKRGRLSTVSYGSEEHEIASRSGEEQAQIAEIQKRIELEQKLFKLGEAQRAKEASRPGPMGTYSAGEGGTIASRQGERQAQIADIEKRIKLEQELHSLGEKHRSNENLQRQQALQENLNNNYQKRIALIRQEEQEILHRNRLHQQEMSILSGPDYHEERAAGLRRMSQEYERVSKMPGQNPQMRRKYEMQAELLSAQAAAATHAAHTEAQSGGRWLSGGVKGLTVPGFAKNILTVTGWSAAVAAMYAPIQLATYSLHRMLDIGLQTQRLEQVFRGVGGNAQQLTGDILKLAAAHGQDTAAAMESAISWSRFGLSRKDVVEATRVSLVAANTASIDPGLASERMGAIYSDFGLKVGELSGALSILERTANTTKVQVKDLMDAIMISGSVARQTGMSFAEFQALIGTTAQRTSQTGNRIATAYKSVIGSLLNPAKQEALRLNFGINVTDANGQIKTSEEIFREMFVAYQKMSTTQRDQFSYLVGDKQQANRFIAMMNSYVQAEATAVDGQLHMNTAQEANTKIMASQTAQLASLRAEWDRFIVTTANTKGAGGVMIPGLGGGIVGAILGIMRNPTNPLAALLGGAKGFGIGAGIGGISSLSGSSSINESLIDVEKFAKNMLGVLGHPAVSGAMGGAFAGRMAGRMAGSALISGTAMRTAAGFAGMSEAELAAMGARFGPWGAVIGGVIGLASGLSGQGPRKLTMWERAERGEYQPGDTSIGSMFKAVGSGFMHPIRTFNAISDMVAGDPFTRFADERAQQVDELKNRSQAYARSAKTINAVGSLMTMKGVTGADKEMDLKNITGLLGVENSKKVGALFNAGDMAGTGAELTRIAEENLKQAQEANRNQAKTLAEGSALAEAQNASAAAKLSGLQGLKPGDHLFTPDSMIHPQGIDVTQDYLDKTVAPQVAALTQEIADRNNAILDSKKQINELDMDEVSLLAESNAGMDQKMHNLTAMADASADIAKQLSDATLSGTTLEALDKQSVLLKEQAEIYKNLGAQFYGLGQPQLGLEYDKKSFDLSAIAARNENPEYRAGVQRVQELQLRSTRMEQESGNAAIGYTDAEKQIARANFDQREGRSAATKDDGEARAQAMERDFHQTRIGLVTHYNALLAEQKQLQMDINRELGKSLLFGAPGDLLTKLSAVRMAQRGGGTPGSGDWFASSGAVRNELWTMSGGERGMENRRQRGAIRNYFGGRIPTVDEEVAEQNKVQFPSVVPVRDLMHPQAAEKKKNAVTDFLRDFFGGKDSAFGAVKIPAAHTGSDAAAKSAADIMALGKSAALAGPALDTFVTQLQSTVAEMRTMITNHVTKAAAVIPAFTGMTVPATLGARP